MSPKWAKKAHFGDISYNVFNRKKYSYLILKPLNFTISWRMYDFNESNHQKMIFVVYFIIIYKNPSVRFWCYRVYTSELAGHTKCKKHWTICTSKRSTSKLLGITRETSLLSLTCCSHLFLYVSLSCLSCCISRSFCWMTSSLDSTRV